MLEDGDGPGHRPQAGVVQAAERPPGQRGEGEGGECQGEERGVVCSHLTGRTLTDGHTSLPSPALLQYYSRHTTSPELSSALHNTTNQLRKYPVETKQTGVKLRVEFDKSRTHLM